MRDRREEGRRREREYIKPPQNEKEKLRETGEEGNVKQRRMKEERRRREKEREEEERKVERFYVHVCDDDFGTAAA